MGQRLERLRKSQEGQDFESNRSDRTAEQTTEETIDLSEIFKSIRKNIWIILAVTVIAGVLSYGATEFFIPKTYAASGTIFLTPKVSEGMVDYNSMNSNQKLVNNVVSLLTQDDIMTAVAQDVNIASGQDVKDMISVTNQTDTELVTVTATAQDAKLAKDIVDNTLNRFVSTMKDTLNVSNIEIVTKPKLDYTPVGPHALRNGAMGAVAGLVLSLAVIVIRVLMDNRLKDRETAESFLGYPVYAVLPDLENNKRK